VQIPKQPGINPATYLHPFLAGPSDNISSLDPTPQFPFGHGLSYTSFEYTELRVSSPALDTAGAVTASVTVTNTGHRAGTEVVQLYFADPVASVTRPVRQLLAFARLDLQPGEARTVSFGIHADRFAFVGPGLTRITEPGAIELQAGSSAAQIRCTATLELTGPRVTVGSARQLITAVQIL
jgi:hypothetical protein